MLFNRHSNLDGKHAFLSPSQYHWLNYSPEKLESRFVNAMAARRGTELHQFAHDAIRLGVRLPDDSTTLNAYVNDALGYKMSTEQPLFYSRNCFGTADAIAFRNSLLRVHDLKTGSIPGSHHQLEVYAALFCLEYVVSPMDIEFELRIYQTDEVRYFEPFPETIVHIMDKIIEFDQRLEQLREEEAW